MKHVDIYLTWYNRLLVWLRIKKKRGLASLEYDELRREKVEIESKQQKLLQELLQLENKDHQLLEKAKSETSPAAQRYMARQIRDARNQYRLQEANMERLGKYIDVVTQFILHKELGQDNPLGDIIKETNSPEIAGIVDEIVSEVEVAEQRLDLFLKAFGDAELSYNGVTEGDGEVDAILAEIQIAAADDAIATESKLIEAFETESPHRGDE